jgi:hypothetical protein
VLLAGARRVITSGTTGGGWTGWPSVPSWRGAGGAGATTVRVREAIVGLVAKENEDMLTFVVGVRGDGNFLSEIQK